jgi:DNA-binding CsgD family transcriptional regulator
MALRPHGPDARELSTYLLALHGKQTTVDYRSMQRIAFEQLRRLIPLEGGLLAVGTIQDGVPHGHDVYLFEKPPALMESWERVKHLDRLAFAATSSPGTTVNVSASGPIYDDGCEAVRAHCARFDLEHMMCTAHIYADAGLYWVMSLYRSARSPAFTEAERETNELVSPHVFAATRNARLGELRALTRVGGGGHGQLAAIASPKGLILEAEPALVEVLRLEWPRWNGPFVPPPLEPALRAGEGRFVGKRVVVRVDAADDARLVHVRPRVAADELTERERAIAEQFSLGDSHREIGSRLGIAPATVRRHLANLYEKLGVSSKAELDRMLRGAD